MLSTACLLFRNLLQIFKVRCIAFDGTGTNGKPDYDSSTDMKTTLLPRKITAQCPKRIQQSLVFNRSYLPLGEEI
jgi:hypothetical protein